MPKLTKEVAIVTDSWLTSGLKTLRDMAERGKVDRRLFAAVADEVEAIRDNWRTTRRDLELQ